MPLLVHLSVGLQQLLNGLVGLVQMLLIYHGHVRVVNLIWWIVIEGSGILLLGGRLLLGTFHCSIMLHRFNAIVMISIRVLLLG